MDFPTAAEKVKTLKTCSDDDKLILYGLYKQATVGDVNTEKPSAIHVEKRAKWNAWNGRKGMSQDEAKRQYVGKVTALFAAA